MRLQLLRMTIENLFASDVAKTIYNPWEAMILVLEAGYWAPEHLEMVFGRPGNKVRSMQLGAQPFGAC